MPMRERRSSSCATPSRTPQDAGDLRVTWRASDVLEQRTGICYAKAHALAALLRAEDIPTALCYQRLAHDDGADTSSTAWSPCASTAPGTARTRGATSRAWTPSSRLDGACLGLRPRDRTGERGEVRTTAGR